MAGQWQGSERRTRLPPDWRQVIRPRILLRDGYLCQIKYRGCQEIADEVDHKVLNDDHSDANLQAACTWCHRKKSSAEGNAVRVRVSARRPSEGHPGLI